MCAVGSVGRLASLLFTALLLATACGPTTAAPAAASASAAHGGTLVFAIWQEPSALSAYYSNQTVTTVVTSVALEGLLTNDQDGNYQPVLATKVPTLQNGGAKISADGTRIDVTYELVPGVKWSDGEPFTSADVKFTWDTIMKDAKVISREGYDQIESIDAPNDLTAVVHYKSLYAPYATRFYSLMPKHVLEKEADISKSDYVRRPIGTGPFKITEFVSADHITAERNPNYRVAGKPLLDRIIFRSVPSREAAVAQLKAGEVDGMWNLLDSAVPDLEKDSSVNVVTYAGRGVERIELNTAKNQESTDPSSKHPVLGELAVRQALIYATPKQQIIDKLLFGKAKPGSSPVTQGWAAPKGLAQESYDPKTANELLDKAGWTRASDGIRTKNGIRAALSITTTTGDKTREQVEQVLITEWKQIGVDLEIKNLPSSVLLSASWSAGDPRKHGVFDMVMYSSSPDIDPQSIMSLRYTSKNMPTPTNQGGQNYTRVQDPVIDAAVAEAGSTIDQEKRRAAYGRALTRLNELAPIIWMYERTSLEAFRTSVFGPKGHVWREITWNTEDWFVRK